MSSKLVAAVIVMANFIVVANSTTVRVHFSRCGFNGFSCSTYPKTNTQAIIFLCPSNDITLYINQFSSPSNIESLQIENCQNLTISFGCTSEIKHIKILTVKNIKLLKIPQIKYTTHVPSEVYFSNIANIEEIPSNTFAQIDHTTHSTGCMTPRSDFHTLSLVNVTIDTVRPRGFHLPTNFGNFTFKNVKINRLQTSAVLAKLDKVSDFTVERCEIDVLEHLAFQITARSVIFKNNKFVDVASSGLNGTTTSLEFTKNVVNMLQPQSISILGTNVRITHNKFEYLKSGALEKISPGLLEDSGRNFGKLKFIYEFKNNIVNYMDAGALSPDFLSYNNVATETMIQGNTLSCECDNIAWIFSEIEHGHNGRHLEDFYETILNIDNNNTCSSPCDLPISAAARLFKNGKCLDEITIETLCHHQLPANDSIIETTPSPIAVTKLTHARVFFHFNGVPEVLASIEMISLGILTALFVQ